jgi:hypothetical protein
MDKSKFEEATKNLQQGDHVCVVIRGNYGNYVVHGEIHKIENGRIYLTEGMSHHYKRIISISTR